MDKLALTKTVVKTITGLGASYIVGSIIQNNCAPETLTDKVKVVAGSVALGMMVSDITAKYTEHKIDEIADWYNSSFKKNA